MCSEEFDENNKENNFNIINIQNNKQSNNILSNKKLPF